MYYVGNLLIVGIIIHYYIQRFRTCSPPRNDSSKIYIIKTMHNNQPDSAPAAELSSDFKLAELPAPAATLRSEL